MQALVEMVKEVKFQPFEKHHAVQIVRHHSWHPPFFSAFWGTAKIRKKNQKSLSRDPFSALHVGMNLVGMERSLDVDLFL